MEYKTKLGATIVDSGTFLNRLHKDRDIPVSFGVKGHVCAGELVAELMAFIREAKSTPATIPRFGPLPRRLLD